MRIISRNYFNNEKELILIVRLLLFMCLTIVSIQSTAQKISKDKAIQIAKRQGYYNTTGNWRTPSVIYDSSQHQWQIISIKYSHVSEGNCSLEKQAKPICNCKNTNGCTDILSKEIRLSARSGKVIKKKVTRKRYPNYE